MKYKLYKLGSITIGRQSLTFLEGIERIEWSTYKQGGDDGDSIPNSFDSPEDCYASIKRLKEIEKIEKWDYFSLDSYTVYVCLPTFSL